MNNNHDLFKWVKQNGNDTVPVKKEKLFFFVGIFINQSVQKGLL